MKPSPLCGIAVHEDRTGTNILVRANANAKAKGPARELLLLIVNSPEHVLLLSPFLLKELESVFDYGRVRAATKLRDEEVAEYLSYIRAGEVSEMVFPGPAPRIVPSDADDDPVPHRRGRSSRNPVHPEP
jgi:hypothetical protein